METIIKVRRLHRKHKLSIRQIAKQLNLNRRTVTKYLQQETLEPPQYQRTRKHYPVLQPYLNTLEQILQQQSRLPPQERQSAKQHYEHLRTLGYTGSYSAVCRFIALHKRQQPAQPTTAFIPLSFEPGEAYQFDWSTEVVKIGGELCKVQCAQFRLSYSRAAFIRCYFKQTTEMFIDAHNHAFTFFGGTTQHGIYDNLKTAVSKILSGKEREFTNSFQCMMDHFCIDPIACTPASGWEKGQIERQVNIHRQWFFKPTLSFQTLADLNDYLAEQCRTQMHQHPHPQWRDRTIAEVFEQEQLSLRRFTQPYPYYRVVHTTVSPYSLVTFESNRYSVPSELVGKLVTLHIYPEHIHIIFEHQVVAEHQRLWQKRQTAYNPWHYLPVLKRKPGALRNGEPFKHWPLPDAVKQLQQHLMKQPKGDKTMVGILALIAEYGEDIGVTAAELALEAGIPTVAAVQNIINRLKEPMIPTYSIPDIPLAIPPQVNLQQYHVLLKHHQDGQPSNQP